MKVKKLENFEDITGSKHCKWSSLDAQSTEIHVSHPILKLGEFPFLKIGPLGQGSAKGDRAAYNGEGFMAN